jgi:hypothetical protein
MKRIDAADVLVVLGSIVIGIGLWLWSVQAALVFGGSVLLIVGILGIRGRLE